MMFTSEEIKEAEARAQQALDRINARADIVASHYPKRKGNAPKRRSTYKFMQYTLEDMHRDK